MISQQRCATLLLLAAVVSAVASKALPQYSGSVPKAGFEDATNVHAVTYQITSNERPATVIESNAGIAGPHRDDGEVEDSKETSEEASSGVDTVSNTIEDGSEEGNLLGGGTHNNNFFNPFRPVYQRPGHASMENLAQLILARRRPFINQGIRLGQLGMPLNDGRLTDMANMLRLMHGFHK